jgi:protein-S-isoprenylcysteine O-methyltransferase Ste14
MRPDRERIESMYQRDRAVAYAFVIALWLALVFVYFEVRPLIPEQFSGLGTVLLIAGLAVLIFNTASIGAMVRHYQEDKDFIYGLDIKHLDEMRARRDRG